MENALRAFNANDAGDHLQHLLKNSYCYPTKEEAEQSVKSKNGPKCNTLERYEAMHVVYEEDYLEENDLEIVIKPKPAPKKPKKGEQQQQEQQELQQVIKKKFERLSAIKPAYLEKILSNLEKYFPTQLLEEFDIFNHQ